MFRYVIVFMACFSSSAHAIEPNPDLVQVLTKYQIAGRCGLRINPTTQFWITNFNKLVSPEQIQASAAAARSLVDERMSLDRVKACIQARADLIADGWL